MNRNKFQYVICPGNNPKAEFRQIYNQIYNCWEALWNEAYREMKIDKELYSDVFTRQDLVGAVLYENKCVGVSCFRWADSLTIDFSKDSYFSLWEEADLKAASRFGSRIIVCSNLAVHPLARGGNLGLSMRELLTGMTTEVFRASAADAMAAHIRIDKKVNEACAMWGAQLIRPNIHFSGGISGDFMVFSKESVDTRSSHQLDGMLRELWNKRLIVPKQYSSQEEFFIQTSLNRKVA